MNPAGQSQLRVGTCLSLSGRFARFGRQAARALEAWASLDGRAQILIEDDASDASQLRTVLPEVAAHSDLLLGPYSTVLMRAAGNVAADAGRLAWNHGGSDDDVQIAHPGHVVSVPTPASRYMEPFLNHLAVSASVSAELRIAYGRGRFGSRVASGAETYARQLGITRLRTGPADTVLACDLPGDWILLTAGTFEDDIQIVTGAHSLAPPPRLICSVAAGVREFGAAITNPAGTFGIAQWFPDISQPPRLGPSEKQFFAAYGTRAGIPEYPAVQAAAAAAIAAHCARLAGSTRREALWQAAAALETSTLFGPFTIDPVSGAQTSHQTVLVQWADRNLATVPAAARGMANP